MSNTKTCPHPEGCTEPIGGDQFLCRHHWQRLPERLRRKVSNAYSLFVNEGISLYEMVCVRRDVLKELSDEPLEEIEMPIASVCRRCGSQLILARLESGTSVSLEREQINPDKEAGGYVVVAGRALVHRSFMPKALARFRLHVCQQAKVVA